MRSLTIALLLFGGTHVYAGQSHCGHHGSVRAPGVHVQWGGCFGKLFRCGKRHHAPAPVCCDECHCRPCKCHVECKPKCVPHHRCETCPCRSCKKGKCCKSVVVCPPKCECHKCCKPAGDECLARELYIHNQETLMFPYWSAWKSRQAAEVWHETRDMPEEQQRAKSEKE